MLPGPICAARPLTCLQVPQLGSGLRARRAPRLMGPCWQAARRHWLQVQSSQASPSPAQQGSSLKLSSPKLRAGPAAVAAAAAEEGARVGGAGRQLAGARGGAAQLQSLPMPALPRLGLSRPLATELGETLPPRLLRQTGRAVVSLPRQTRQQSRSLLAVRICHLPRWAPCSSSHEGLLPCFLVMQVHAGLHTRAAEVQACQQTSKKTAKLSRSAAHVTRCYASTPMARCCAVSCLTGKVSFLQAKRANRLPHKQATAAGAAAPEFSSPGAETQVSLRSRPCLLSETLCNITRLATVYTSCV